MIKCTKPPQVESWMQDLEVLRVKFLTGPASRILSLSNCLINIALL